MNLVELAVLGFAAFRLSRLIIDDTITEPLRDWLLTNWPGTDVEYDPEDRHRVKGGTIEIGSRFFASAPTWTGNRLAKLIGCYACTGFWISLGIAAAYWSWPAVTVWIMLPFALSGFVWLLALVQERID